jgi:hypothetical protein
MADDQDYEELLSQNVGEVKSSIRDLDEPDYRQLLQLEREGKDRKTVKEFLENRLEDEDTEEEEVEDAVDDEAEDIVEDIEEDTSEGLLGSFSRSTVLASGVILGVLIGLIAAYGALGSTSSDMVSQEQVESSVTELFTASGTNASQFEVVDYTTQEGMHYMTVNITQQTQNGTQTQSQSYFVSPGGNLLFPELQSALVQTPIDIDQTIQQIEAQQNQQSGNTTQ